MSIKAKDEYCYHCGGMHPRFLNGCPNISNLTWDKIKNTPEGELLKCACSIMCLKQFSHLFGEGARPDLIFEVIKDIKTNIFVSESLYETMQRIVEKHKSKNN